MVRTRALSPIARTVVAMLLGTGDDWSHGYDLCRRTGVKSGTLYPLLIRLEAQGLLEAQWQPSSDPGRPPRHAYRLTSAGRQFARENSSDAPTPARGALSTKPA